MTVDVKTVLALHQELLKRYGEADALSALRTEVHALLQAESPPPYSKRPPHLDVDRLLTPLETREIHLHMREQVKDEEYLASEKARAKLLPGDVGHRDAHHFLQKKHGISLWEKTDKLIATAFGVKK